MVICPERGADLHMMPLPLTVSCFSKIQIGFTFLVPAHPGSPGKGSLNGCVCVCVCVCVRVCARMDKKKPLTRNTGKFRRRTPASGGGRWGGRRRRETRASGDHRRPDRVPRRRRCFPADSPAPRRRDGADGGPPHRRRRLRAGSEVSPPAATWRAGWKTTPVAIGSFSRICQVAPTYTSV